jgi:hypothetical protein
MPPQHQIAKGYRLNRRVRKSHPPKISSSLSMFAPTAVPSLTSNASSLDGARFCANPFLEQTTFSSQAIRYGRTCSTLAPHFRADAGLTPLVVGPAGTTSGRIQERRLRSRAGLSTYYGIFKSEVQMRRSGCIGRDLLGT